MKKFVHSKKSKGFFLMSNVKYLGIDIGGAHFKLVGLDEKNSVCFAEYRKCYVWEGLQNLRKEIDYTNS